MAKAQGKVQQVFVKALAEPDKYGKTHRASIKLDDDQWYGMGTIKGENLSVQDDDGKWVPLGVGSEVILKYEQNGEYRNSSRSDMMVLNLVVGEKKSYEKKATGSSNNTGSGSVDWSKRDAGIEAGHAINGAIQLICHGKTGSAESLIDVAIRIHQDTRELQRRIMAKELSAPIAKDEAPAKKPAVSKKKAAESEPEASEWIDDEIPF
jgi:hypothetical protein